MKPLLFAITLLTLSFTTARAQDWAKARVEKSPRHLEWVKIKHANREVNSFIAFPEVREKATAVVVIHTRIYEGAGHGFMRAGEAPDASESNKKAREESWKCLKDLLRKV